MSFASLTHTPLSHSGDFGSLAPPPTAFTGTAFYYFNAILLARLATALGESADAEVCHCLAFVPHLHSLSSFMDSYYHH